MATDPYNGGVPPLLSAERLKNWALAEGFHRVGVARLRPSSHADAFERWIARGDHAAMGYLERRREVRLDPRRLFDGAASVLCVALQYAPAEGPEAEGDLWPFVARYARGRDYHRVMEGRLAALERRIQETVPGCTTRRYVDTGPVLERELAERAGLGAVGKNTNLLHPEAGSWFLLGELFLDLELAPDVPLSDLCGRCTRCLEACPTGALPEPYRLDSRRCISYWTIEHRGPIPAEMRPRMEEWVFGCDICQEVCPVNDRPLATADPSFEPDPGRRALDLEALLELDQESYLERFRGSPMKRARLDGLRRNAAVAMGNRADPRYRKPLLRALAEPDPLVRGHAAWALGRLGGPEAVAGLERALGRERDPEVARELRAAVEAAAGDRGSATDPR